MASGIHDWTYEAVPEAPGAVRFYDQNEKPLMLTGPTAAELANRIDTAKRNLAAAGGVGPQPVAGPGGGDPAENFDPKAPFADINLEPTRYTGPRTAPMGGSPTPTQPGALTGLANFAKGALGLGGAPASQSPPASIAAPAAPTGPVGGAVPLGFGLRRSPQGTIQKFGGGSKAVTSEDIEKKAEGARVLPTSQAVSTTGGFAPSEDYLRGSLDIAKRKAELLGEIRDTNAAALASDVSSKANQNAMLAQHAQEQQQLQAEIDKRVKEDEARAEQARNDYQGAKVDPNRIFAGEGGTLKAIAMAVSAALGAAGATLGRTENSAQNMINGIINRDIAAQEAEISVKRDSASNAMADLQRSGLTRDQSRTLLRQIQRDYVASLADKQAAESKLGENDSNYKMLKLGLEKETLDFLEKYRRESLGTRTEQVNGQYAFEKAATASGWHDVPDQIGTATKLQGIRETDADIAKKQADATKAANEAKTGPDQKSVPTERTDKIAKNVQAIGQALKVQEMLGTQRGSYSQPSGSLTPTWAPGDGGEKYDELEQATTALVTTEQSASGIGSTADDRANTEAKARGNNSIDGRRRGAEFIASEAAGRAILELSTLPPADQARILESMPPEVRAQILQKMSK